MILYNLACDRALAGETDDARRLLRTAFTHHHELVVDGAEDRDLTSLRDQLKSLADLA